MIDLEESARAHKAFMRAERERMRCVLAFNSHDLHDLPARERNALLFNYCYSRADVAALDDEKLLRLRNIGPVGVRTIRAHIPHLAGQQ